MIESKSLKDLDKLTGAIAAQWIDECARSGIVIRVTCTYRDVDAQRKLWDQGRHKPGLIVTDSQPGMSWHQYRRAVDFAIMKGREVDWRELESYKEAGILAEGLGFVWSGRWEGRLREMCHIHFAGMDTIESLMAKGY